jgi:hypothetical protein
VLRLRYCLHNVLPKAGHAVRKPLMIGLVITSAIAVPVHRRLAGGRYVRCHFPVETAAA